MIGQADKDVKRFLYIEKEFGLIYICMLSVFISFNLFFKFPEY